VALVNEGNAFNLTRGIFTVPVPGIYHFDFSAVKSSDIGFLSIILQVNSTDVGNAFTQQPAKGSWDVVSLSASLRLAAGDTVKLYLYSGTLSDDSYNQYTHFSGWLVDEDLM